MTETTHVDFKMLARRWFNESLDEIERMRMEIAPHTEGGRKEVLHDMRALENIYRNALGRGDFALMEGSATALLKEQGVILDPASPEFRQVAMELLRTSVQAIRVERKRFQGKLDGEIEELISTSAPPSIIAPQQSPTTTPSILISEAFEAYEREVMKGQRWTEKTRETNRAMIQTLIEIVGDRPITSFDKAAGRGYKDGLQRYPRNRRKDPRYRDNSLATIWTLAKVDTLSITSINNHIIAISSFGAWAVKQGYLDSNPFRGLTISKREKGEKERAKDSVLPFTKEELERIFGSAHYREHQYKYPHEFWLPLLGLYTGGRIEELCALEVADIREIDGVVCFNITDEGGRHLKTESSKRLIPIHPKLIEIGLLDFVEAQRAAKRKRMFPELTMQGGKVSHYASKWFGRLKQSMGFQGRKKVFHSFRHTFVAELRRRRAQDYEMRMLLGHKTYSVTHDVYGGGGDGEEQEVKGPHEVVKSLDYGIDLSHLLYRQPVGGQAKGQSTRTSDRAKTKTIVQLASDPVDSTGRDIPPGEA